MVLVLVPADGRRLGRGSARRAAGYSLQHFSPRGALSPHRSFIFQGRSWARPALAQFSDGSRATIRARTSSLEPRAPALAALRRSELLAARPLTDVNCRACIKPFTGTIVDAEASTVVRVVSRTLRDLVCSPFLPSAPILPGPTGLIIREIFRRTSKQKRTIQRLCGEQLGFFDPSGRAASVSLLRARGDLHLAQAERLARDVVLDLLLDGQLLAMPPV